MQGRLAIPYNPSKPEAPKGQPTWSPSLGGTLDDQTGIWKSWISISLHLRGTGEPEPSLPHPLLPHGAPPP